MKTIIKMMAAVTATALWLLPSFGLAMGDRELGTPGTNGPLFGTPIPGVEIPEPIEPPDPWEPIPEVDPFMPDGLKSHDQGLTKPEGILSRDFGVPQIQYNDF